MLALHPPSSVFSLRHTPSWLALAFAAGSVNAAAFLACSRFVTHVTGTVISIGMNMASLALALDYALVFACFVLGAMSSAALIDGRYHRNKRPIHAAPLVAVAAVLLVVAIGGMAGAFGAFGGSVERPSDFAFLSLLAFAMGLQNAAVATTTGQLVRTTHLTGPATDLGVHLTSAVVMAGEPRRVALLNAALRAGKIIAFAIGGAVGVVLARRFEFGAFLLPAGIVLVATALSFIPSTIHQPQELSS